MRKLPEEERKRRHQQANAKWRANNPNYFQQWKERNPLYATEYYEAHRDELCQKQRTRRANDKETFRQRQKQYRANNPGYTKDYYARNREACHARYKKWVQNNPHAFEMLTRKYATQSAAKVKAWRSANPHKVAEYSRVRYSIVRSAKPTWFEEQAVALLYRKRDELNKRFGLKGQQQLVVDHIIPLVSDTVCGLHCHANLQLLNRWDNSVKGTTYQEDWS